MRARSLFTLCLVACLLLSSFLLLATNVHGAKAELTEKQKKKRERRKRAREEKARIKQLEADRATAAAEAKRVEEEAEAAKQKEAAEKEAAEVARRAEAAEQRKAEREEQARRVQEEEDARLGAIADKSSDANRAKREKRRNKRITRTSKRDAQVDRRTALRLKKAQDKNKRISSRRQKHKDNKAKKKKTEIKRMDTLAKKKIQAYTEESIAAGQAKLNWLRKQTERSPSKIISVDSAAFDEFVNNGPRPYYVVLTLTAIGPGTRCSHCHIMHDGMVPLAQAYFEQHGEVDNQDHDYAALRGDIEALEALNKPVFFIEADVTRCRETFDKLGLNSAPTLVVVPPKMGSKAGKVSQFLARLKPKYRYKMTSANIGSKDINDFISKHIGKSTTVTTPINPLAVIALVFFGASALAILYACRNMFVTLRKFKVLFFMLSCLGYLFCSSGGMFNMIRNSPFSKRDAQGNTQYIATQGRQQYIAETWMLYFLNFFTSLCCILAIRNGFTTESKTANKKNKSMGEQMIDMLVPFMSPPVCLAAFAYFWYNELTVYSIKTWGYNHGWINF